MQYETRKRSILKTLSYRTWGTITTAVIVFLFTGKLTVAVTVGLLEVFSKMGLYFLHERFWQKIRWGKKEVPAFVLWFTGLPASGKKAVADAVYQQLKKDGLRVERLDSLDVRPLFPQVGFAPADVDHHVRRSGHLCSMLEKNGVTVVASLVSPYRPSREFVRRITGNFVEIYMQTTPEACERRDAKGHYQKARAGEYEYFPGVHVDYERPHSPEIVIDIDHLSTRQATEQVISYLRKNILNGRKAASSREVAVGCSRTADSL